MLEITKCFCTIQSNLKFFILFEKYCHCSSFQSLCFIENSLTQKGLLAGCSRTKIVWELYLYSLYLRNCKLSEVAIFRCSIIFKIHCFWFVLSCWGSDFFLRDLDCCRDLFERILHFLFFSQLWSHKEARLVEKQVVKAANGNFQNVIFLKLHFNFSE